MDVGNSKSIRQPHGLRILAIAPYIGSVLVLMMLPLFIPSYVQSIMTKALIMAIFAISLDLLLGYVGLVSLGHAAYFGIAGYTTGILAVRYGIENFWLVAPTAILMAGFTGMIFGFLALRSSGGSYFLLITFATAQLLYSVVLKWRSMTGGNYGLPGIMRPDLGIHWSMLNTTNFYYFVFIILILSYFLLYRIINSPFGHALQGIREDERRMRALGYNTWAFKYIAFVISAIYAGAAGVLFTYFGGIVAPDYIGALTSFVPLIMVMIGGVGTLFGPVLGAMLIVWVEYFTSIYAPERWPLIEGIIFVVVIMYFREGIGVSLRDFWKRVRYRYAGFER